MKLPILVVGGGVAGLAAAAALGRRGEGVVLLERAASVGGKMRAPLVAGRAIDSGPTVLTMRWVFDELWDECGRSFEDDVPTERCDVLARHAWAPLASSEAPVTLDLFADVEQTVDAIGTIFGAAQASGYRRFARYTEEIFQSVDGPMLRSPRPTLGSLAQTAGELGLAGLRRMDGMRSMWRALGDFFDEPRLRQLFGRYATYCGSSPFEASAALNVIAHVERLGVHRVRGGMSALAAALRRLAEGQGVSVRTGAEVREIVVVGNRARGVRLASGEVLEGRAVVLNGAVDAARAGLLGEDLRRSSPEPGPRSLSAVTWSIAGEAAGFPLAHHTVCFSDDYREETKDLFGRGRVPMHPTVYVCASDRRDDGSPLTSAVGERLFVLMNAPATGDRAPWGEEEIERCRTRTFRRLARCGLSLREEGTVTTTPLDFERMFPGTGGALYGGATHGFVAPLRRAGSRSKLPGLYFAGGTVHPGAGVPMAATSGRLAADAVSRDLRSISSSVPARMLGGMSTR